MIKTPTRVLTAISACLAMTLAGSALAEDRSGMQCSHVGAESATKGDGAVKFQEIAEKLSTGKVTVRVFPRSRLLGEAKEMEAVLLGDAQFIAPSVSKFDRYTKK